MKRRFWKVKEINDKAQTLAREHGISVFLAQVFLNRRIKEEDFRSFLDPKPSDLHCPTLLPDANKAVDRIRGAISNKEKVLVFGDYDVDGITSLAIFNEFAKGFPEIFSFHIPHRVKEGYGLNRERIVQASEEKVSLIIAFDCGTNSHSQIELAHSLGIDIIVIDHHHPKGEMTRSFAFVNPKREDSLYPFSDLSAGALSFKIIQLLMDSDCRDALDLLALSLVCDVVPLKGENRILLKEGLKVIKNSQRPAIKALCKSGGIKQENITTFHIGYILGPRINASGRVAHANSSLELFLSDDDKIREDIATKLGEYNKIRKVIESDILRQAESIVKENINNDNAIVVSGDGWHPGVLGIVASRLTEKYHRPSFVISFDEDIGKGSARSVDSVHLINILEKCSESFILYGGHSMAAGVTIKKNELENFKNKINLLIEEELTSQSFIPSMDIDAAIDFENIDLVLANNLEKMKPYGEGNPEALFVSYGVIKKSSCQKKRMGFSAWFTHKNRTLEAVIYDKDIVELIEYGNNFDIVFSLEKNNYYNEPRLIARDCRLSEEER